MTSEHLNYHRYRASPSGLMTRTNSCSIVTVKILVEQYQIFPMRVGLKLGCAAVDCSWAFLVSDKDTHQPPSNFLHYLE